MWVSIGVRSIRPALHQVEVVLDPVLAHARRPPRPRRRWSRPSEISLKYSGAPLPPGGAVHAALDQRAPLAQEADPDLERLGLADGVVHDVDAARDGTSAARRGAAIRWPPDQAASSSMICSRSSEPTTIDAPRRRARVGLGVESGDDRDLDVGVQGAEDRDRAACPSDPAP